MVKAAGMEDKLPRLKELRASYLVKTTRISSSMSLSSLSSAIRTRRCKQLPYVSYTQNATHLPLKISNVAPSALRVMHLDNAVPKSFLKMAPDGTLKEAHLVDAPLASTSDGLC
eukprot:3908567-Amphidinium_carterae.1